MSVRVLDVDVRIRFGPPTPAPRDAEVIARRGGERAQRAAAFAFATAFAFRWRFRRAVGPRVGFTLLTLGLLVAPGEQVQRVVRARATHLTPAHAQRLVHREPRRAFRVAGKREPALGLDLHGKPILRGADAAEDAFRAKRPNRVDSVRVRHERGSRGGQVDPGTRAPRARPRRLHRVRDGAEELAVHGRERAGVHESASQKRAHHVVRERPRAVLHGVGVLETGVRGP